MTIAQDQSILYHSTLQKVENIIAKLKQAKMDTAKYESAIKEIEKEYDQNIQSGFNSEIGYSGVAMQRGDNVLTSCHAIKELEAVYREIMQYYDEYIRVTNCCEILEKRISTNHVVSSDDVNKMIEEVIQSLNILQNSSNVAWNEEAEIVTRTYLLAYKIIRIEIYSQIMDMKDPNSRLLTVIQTRYPEVIPDIEKEIQKELNLLHLNSRENKEILLCVKAIDSKGLNHSYFNNELIGLLVKKNPPYSQSVHEEYIANIDKKIESLADKSKASFDTIHRHSWDATMAKEELNKRKKKTIRNLVVYGLSAATFLGGLHLIPKVVTHSMVDIRYQTTQEIFIEGYGNLPVASTFKKETENSTVLIVSEPWYYTDKGYRRKVNFYDVNDVLFQDIADYTQIDLSERKCDSKEEVKHYFLPGEEYTESYKTVIRTQQDKSVTDDLTDYEKMNSLIDHIEFAWKVVLGSLGIAQLLLLFHNLRKMLSAKKSVKTFITAKTMEEEKYKKIQAEITKSTTIQENLKNFKIHK